MPAYKYQTKAGKQFWYASFCYTAWNGESKRMVKRGFKTKKEALEFERSFLDHGHKDPALLFTTLIDEYYADCETRLKPTTVANKKQIIEIRIRPVLGKMRVCDIDSRVVRNWQNQLLKEAEKEHYSQTYVKSISIQLSALMNYAVKYYNLARNPCHAAGSIGKAYADEMNIWSRDQFEHVMSFEKRIAYHAAFDTLYYTGMREGELLALTPEDIPEDQLSIRVNKTFAVVDDQAMFLTPKTEKSDRIIQIDKALHDELITYIKGMYIHSDERIFYFEKDGLLKEFHRITDKAGEPRIRIHDLRHSHVALLIEMGIPITEIARRLGHSSPQTTLKVYAHLYPGKERNVADLIGNLRGKGSDGQT